MTPREGLFREVQEVLAGGSERDALSVLISCLVVGIGTASETIAQANAVIDALPSEMKASLREEWEKTRAHRAKIAARHDFEAKFGLH